MIELRTDLRTGDIVIWRSDFRGAYDAGIIDMSSGEPCVIRFLPFKGQITAPLKRHDPYQNIYRYVGRNDSFKKDHEIASEAVGWIKRWTTYRYSTRFWIAVARIPFIRRLVKYNYDKSKVRADYGFTGSTAIVWAFECAGIDLIPCQSPDLSSVNDLLRCPLLKQIE